MGIVKTKIINYQNQKYGYPFFTLFVICKLINKKWNRKQVHGNTQIHYSLNDSKGQFNGKSNFVKYGIIKLEYGNRTVIIVSKFGKVKGNGKKRDRHPGNHHDKEPAATITIFQYQEDNGE
jgi:hypothetical protein